MITSEARTPSAVPTPSEHEAAEGDQVPWNCGRAGLAGTIRTARSVDGPGVLWTCRSRERSSAPVFTGEACRGCREWRPRTTPLGAAPAFDAVECPPASYGVVTVHRYDRGATIVEEGGRADALLTIVCGAVKRFTTTPAGKAIGIEICGPGTPLGAEAVIGDLPLSASAVALEETTCVAVSRRALLALLQQHPELARQMVCEADERLEALMNRITDLAASRVEARFARLFLELARRLGRREHGTLIVRLPLQRQDLADLTCTTIETCIRVMSRWNKQGVVRTAGRSFLIDDLKIVEALGGR